MASLKILTKCIGFKERMANDNKIRSINNINKKWDLTTSTYKLRKYLAIEKCWEWGIYRITMRLNELENTYKRLLENMLRPWVMWFFFLNDKTVERVDSGF